MKTSPPDVVTRAVVNTDGVDVRVRPEASVVVTTRAAEVRVVARAEVGTRTVDVLDVSVAHRLT